MAERSIDDRSREAQGVQDTSIEVTIRYYAAARAAAGVPEERIRVQAAVPGQRRAGPGGAGQGGAGQDGAGDSSLPQVLPAARSTVGELLDAAADRHGPGLAKVLARCSYLLDEVAVHGRQTPVLDGQVLDILPPFAGG